MFVITDMLVDVTIHHGASVKHNLFEYLGGQSDVVGEYDMDY